MSDDEPPDPATVFVKPQFLIMKGIGEGVSRVCLARHLTYTKDPVRSGDLVMTTGVPSAPVWGGVRNTRWLSLSSVSLGAGPQRQSTMRDELMAVDSG